MNYHLNFSRKENTNTMAKNRFFNCFGRVFLIIAVVTMVFLSLALSSCNGGTDDDVSVSDPLPDGKKSGSSENSEYRWDVYEEYVEITSYVGDETKVNVPKFLDGLPVMSIGKEAFANSSVETVKLPETVVKIDNKAFFKCSSLKNIEMPNVVIIEMSAFRDSALETVSLPQSLQSVGKYAFENTCLETVSIPDGVLFMGDYLFSGCKSLESFEIHSSNAEITAYMFYGCSSLSDVTISDNIVKICDYAFAYCDNLKSITVPQSVSEMGFGIFYETPDVTVKTFSGSAAESFSQKNGINFELIK